MGKKHKKYKKQQFKRQPTPQETELSLKLSIPLSSLPRFSETSSSESKNQELTCKIQIQKADLSAFVIPKRKEAGHEVSPSLQAIKLHGKKHKKKKHRHHHDNKVEPIHIAKSHDSQTSQSDSSQSVEKHSSPHHSSANSPLKKLSIVIPKLNSSPIPTSSPLLTYNPVQMPHAEVQPDNDTAKQDVSTSQTKQSASTDLTTKVSTHQQMLSSEHCSTSITNELAASEELQKLKTNVKYALKTLQYQLEKRDPQGIFAEPVTDEIAPGYSALISNPMDFSTMAKKIDTLQYQSIDEYKEDFLLMCNNCMTYNPEDTVFYQAAKKLLSSGLKLIAKEAAKKTDLLVIPAVSGVSNYSRSSTPLSFQAPFSKRSISPAPSSTREHSFTAPTTRSQSNGNSLMCRIPLSVLQRHGIRLPISSNIAPSTLTNTSLSIIDGDVATTSLSSTAQWVADTMSAAAAPPYDDTGMTKLRVGWSSDSSGDSSDEEEYDNVLEQVQAAAATAHEAVMNKEAVDLAYLDTSEAGKAMLNILNPDGGVAREMRNIDMTELEAAIAEGEEANKKLELEHSRHKTTPVAYLMYGPYGAFAPYFDSSFATLTRMDSSLLYSVYGDDMGVTYAHSLQRFVRGTSSFACEMAEAILNGLTSNKHRLLKEKLTEQRDKLFHMSQQQQQQEQEDKVPENDGKDHQLAATTTTTTTSGTDVKENDSSVSTTVETTSVTDTNPIVTSTVTTSAVSSSTTTTTAAATAAASTATAAAVAVPSQADKEKLPQPVLDKNVEILLQLQQLQNERLSRPPFTVPQSQETATALQVAENLKQLTSKITPGDVASVQALQNAMGITVTTSNSVTTPHSNDT